MTPEERARLIEVYASAPLRLRDAVARTPPGALKWRPSRDDFSVHEIAVHCADSETNAHMRIRYVTGEPNATIVGYNESHWARFFDYHSHPLELALATVEAVRANTAALLRRLPESAWQSEATHTESGRYTAQDWLAIYSQHLEDHVAQIDANIEAWRAAQ